MRSCAGDGRAVAPRPPHIVGAATLLTLPFYRDTLALRLGPDGRLRPIDPARGAGGW